jgi:hypothetical protein
MRNRPVLVAGLAWILAAAAAVALLPGAGEDWRALAVALGLPVVVTAVPVLAARSRRVVVITWTAAAVLLAWSLLAFASVGMFLLPAALVEFWAAVLRTGSRAAGG